MPHASDEYYDWGHHHDDYHPEYRRSRRERSRLEDGYDDRADLKTSDAARENHDSESRMRVQSETGHYERPVAHYRHRHSHSPKPSRENYESGKRGRSETRHHERSGMHTRYSHSVEPPRDHRRHHGDTHRLTRGQHKKVESHVMEKAISTAATTAFRLRHGEGSWVGRKGLMVVGAAIATAALDAAFDENPKEHMLKHIAVSMAQGAVMDAFATSGEGD